LGRPQASFVKRQREQQRREKAAAKAEKRAQKKTGEKSGGPEIIPDEDFFPPANSESAE
jgi:hypothetical protein